MDLRDIGTLVQIGAAVSPGKAQPSSSASSSLTVLRCVPDASRSALFMPGVSLSFIKIQLLQVCSFQFAFEKILLYRSLHPRRCVPGLGAPFPPPCFFRTYRGASLSIMISVCQFTPSGCNPRSSWSPMLSATRSRKGWGTLIPGS